jgi:hypothetical protein
MKAALKSANTPGTVISALMKASFQEDVLTLGSLENTEVSKNCGEARLPLLDYAIEDIVCRF